MRTLTKIMLAVLLLAALPPVVSAQSDICQKPYITGGSTDLLIEQAKRDEARADWTVSLVPVKFATTETALKPLCIFGIEVIPHTSLKLVGLKAPKALMPAIEAAMKQIDVQQPPPPAPRSVDVVAYALIVSEATDPRFMPVPPELQSVVNQLKSVLPKGTAYLLDTMVVRGRDYGTIKVNGSAVFNQNTEITGLTANVRVHDGTPASVRLDSLVAQAGNSRFETSIDVPVGTYAVVGKGTSSDSQKRTVVFVLTAKVVN
jgi:hypothetical protein